MSNSNSRNKEAETVHRLTSRMLRGQPSKRDEILRKDGSHLASFTSAG